MTDINQLHATLKEKFSNHFDSIEMARTEITIILHRENLTTLCNLLKTDPACYFDMLVDVCGVDYLQYGVSEWTTDAATGMGFERGVRVQAFEDLQPMKDRPRFAVVYHLLSIQHNHRLRLRVLLEESDLIIPSVIDIWPSANWFEREAFDMFGIMFHGHPDLRRLLTDYGFIGHPFRKDFPLIGQVEARYDATLKRVIYEPVNIEARVLEPKVIRKDNRYESGE